MRKAGKEPTLFDVCVLGGFQNQRSRTDLDFVSDVHQCRLRNFLAAHTRAVMGIRIADEPSGLTPHQNGVIATMVAGYTKNLTGNLAFVSIMATRKEYRGQGLASKQLAKFLEECRKVGASGAHVYAVESNLPAVATYKKLGFEKYELENEPRPDDLHLIKRFKEKEE